MNKIFYGTFFIGLMLPLSATAMPECQGDLTRESFKDERKQLQADLQKSIIDYRKAERDVPQNPELKAELPKIMARIEQQKKTFQEFDSKYFPRTPVTALGAACNDMRWIQQAKEKLIEKPEHLGKQWFVWLDKTTRKPSAAVTRPAIGVIAE